jgi:PAS domain S-box-containing protein
MRIAFMEGSYLESYAYVQQAGYMHLAMDRPPLPPAVLRISETLLDRTGAYLYVVDRRERVHYINRALSNRTDITTTSASTLYTLLSSLYPDPAFRDSVLLTHQRLLAGAPKREVEWVLTTNQGEQRQLRWQFQLLDAPAAENQDPMERRLLVAIGEDVTDRRKLEQWVRLQNALLARVEEAIVVADTTGRVLHWTGGAERVLGYSARNAMERPLANIMPDTRELSGAKTVERWLEELRESGAGEWVRSLKKEAGDSIECRIRGSRVLNERAQMVGIALMIVPVGAVVESEAEDQEQTDPGEQRLEKALGQTSAVALVIVGPSGGVRIWGRGAERLGGIGATRAVGKVLFDEVMHVNGFSWESLATRIANRGRFQTRVVIERPNGTQVPAEMDAIAVKEGDNTSAILCFFGDRSELQALAEEALGTKARGLAGVFTEGVIRRIQDACTWFEPDHRFILARLQDLRALARMVRQGASMRDVDSFVRHARMEELDMAMDDTMYRLGEGVHRLRSLVDDVTRFEANEIDPPGPIRLARELEAARELVAHSFEGRVVLEISLEDLPPARASRAPLLRGLCLLLLAAVEGCTSPDAAVENPKVTIEGRHENGWVFLEIRDNGAGFGVNIQSRIGDLSYLAAQSGSAPLFLGLARESLRTAGGTMELSTASGSGSRLKVSFPGAVAAVAVQSAAELSRPRATSGKVLLVEEDELLRRAFERHIGERHSVSSYATITEALHHLEGHDAAVLSFPRPDGIGLKLIQKVAETAPGLFRNTLVVVPPGLKFSTREKLLALGCVILQRPVDLSTLRSLLARLTPVEEVMLGEAEEG